MTKTGEDATAQLARELEALRRARRDAYIQLKPHECAKRGHDYTTSTVCRKCGYEEPFEPMKEG